MVTQSTLFSIIILDYQVVIIKYNHKSHMNIFFLIGWFDCFWDPQRLVLHTSCAITKVADFHWVSCFLCCSERATAKEEGPWDRSAQGTIRRGGSGPVTATSRITATMPLPEGGFIGTPRSVMSMRPSRR
jgi:hypothetical protein